MKISRWQPALICAALLFFATQVLAKRVAHKPGVLWRVKLFHNRIRFWIEEDNQWIYITDLKLATNSLLVRDERPRCYSVDLVTRRVRKFGCGSVFAP